MRQKSTIRKRQITNKNIINLKFTQIKKKSYDLKLINATARIKEHKHRINIFLCDLIFKFIQPTIVNDEACLKDWIIAIDDINNNSRNIFKKKKFKDEDIFTCNSELDEKRCIDNITNEYLINLLDRTIDNICCLFADTTQNPKNAILQIIPAFKQKLLVNNSILALTVCSMYVSAKNYDKYYENLIKEVKNYNYILDVL